jgi:hypothetical protein
VEVVPEVLDALVGEVPETRKTNLRHNLEMGRFKCAGGTALNLNGQSFPSLP